MRNTKTENLLIESLVEKYRSKKGDIEGVLKITGVDPEFYELASEVLGLLLGKVVWLVLEEGESLEKKNSIVIKEGFSFNINTLLDLGYERVERVWNEGEVSVLGDVVLIWPFSMNSLFV